MSSKWPVAKLGDLCIIQRGGSPRPIDDYITESPNGINWIKIGDVGEGEKYIISTKQKIRPEGAQNSRFVEVGDFLLTNSMSFGRPYILRTSGCIHDGWLVLRYDNQRLTEDYLYHALSSNAVYDQFVKMASGAVVKNLNSDVVKEVKIPLPPMVEQCRIAAILDKADNLRWKQLEAMNQLDRLTQSIFLDMFDEVKQIHEISSGITLGEFCDLFNGYAFKSTDYVEVSSTLNCRMSNIRPNGEFDVNYNPRFLPDSFANTYKEFLLKDGDVIIAMTDMANEPKILGVPTIVNTEGRILLLNQRVGKLIIKSPEKLRVTFLKQLLSQQYARKHLQKFGGGGLQINLGKKDILSTPIFVPDITKQIKFEKRLERLSQFRKKLEKSLRENDSLISSLQYLAFNGSL